MSNLLKSWIFNFTEGQLNKIQHKIEPPMELESINSLFKFILTSKRVQLTRVFTILYPFLIKNVDYISPKYSRPNFCL